MKLKFYQPGGRIFLRKIPALITCGIILSTASLFISYKDGPASHGEHVTGAPFDSSKFCTKCHGGGNFGASILAKLFRSDSTIVTAYTPGQNYYFVIIYKKTTGTPLHGFQTTSATTASGTNVNGWRNSLPAGTANRVVIGHNYIEHTAPFSSDTMIIPWKAPAAGTGSVTFYTACNFVNGNNKPTGDQPVKSSFTVAEGPTAIAATSVSSVDVFADKIKPDLNPGMVVYQHSGIMYMRYNNTGDNQSAYITVSDISGRLVYTGKVFLNKGNNIFPVQSNNSKGMVIATIVRADGLKTSKKIVLE